MGAGVPLTAPSPRQTPAVDKYGGPRPYVGGQVDLTVDGPAALGDNPFAFADAGGVGAVWIRTLPGSAGTITVSVKLPPSAPRPPSSVSGATQVPPENPDELIDHCPPVPRKD